MADEFKAFLTKIKILNNVKSIDSAEIKTSAKSIKEAYECETEIDGSNVTLQIAFDNRFPISKPLLFLKDPKALGFIPHIETNGKICYMQDFYILDVDNPEGIIDYCVNKACRILYEGKTGLNRIDFIREFESNWVKLGHIILVNSILTIDNCIKLATAYKLSNSYEMFLGDNKDIIQEYIKTLTGKDIVEGSSNRLLYIPLNDSKNALPPENISAFNIQYIKELIFNNIKPSAKSHLLKLLKKSTITPETIEYIILSMPHPDDSMVRIVFGLVLYDFSYKKLSGYSKKGIPHPLLINQSNYKMLPVSVSRQDKEFLIPRTGGRNDLARNNVLVVGCGSVGSGIINELVKAGIEKITIVDNDRMKFENVYRHLIGKDNIYDSFNSPKDNKLYMLEKYKVNSIRTELKHKYFNVDIKPVEDDILNTIWDENIDLTDFDLIIVAIGDPTVELVLNRYLHEKVPNIPVIYSWLEPLGIGGHALLTSNNGKTGCYECLFMDNNSMQKVLFNKSSFAGQGQYFGKTVSGCGSTFIPYTSLDTMQTVIMTVRLAINTLLNVEKDNPLVSWKGDRLNFTAQGYRTSDRFEAFTQEQLYENRYNYKCPCCPVCNK